MMENELSIAEHNIENSHQIVAKVWVFDLFKYLDNKKREPQRLSYAILIGGDEGTRTPGLLTASQTRSQLRHTPKSIQVLDTSIV